MADTDLLRPSRDGDQFHYRWAARQALRLLCPGSELTAIAVEGVSPDDPDWTDGEEVIDLAEYYGATGLPGAQQVVYRQLKHSTLHANEEFTVSSLRKTLQGFAKVFREIKNECPGDESKVRFEFVSNRRVRLSVQEAIEAIASESVLDDEEHDVRYLRKYAGFSDDAHGEAEFFRRFKIDSSAPGLLTLDSLFQVEVGGFLPGAVDVEHVLLKEMIARRATSLESSSLVTRSTVLMALKTIEQDLLPSPSRIQRPDNFIVTMQTRTVVTEIVGTPARPVIVHASGGIGKSVLTTQIQQSLPDGSLTIVYDCFGNGDYRRSSQPRHHHRQGLVQLSNELATHSLCDPLIPVTTAHASGYSRAFLTRMQTAAGALAARTPGALLAIVVDAADNAALIARDVGEQAFVTDLLREPMPANVRLVMLCRTERIDLLTPPPHARRIELTGFAPEDTRRHLATAFGDVTERQAEEVHRRTGGNPRIQAFAMESAADIDSCLRTLGEPLPGHTAQLDELLLSRVDDCKDAHHGTAAEIDRLCEALAALRPRIPVRVLSNLCDVSEHTVHSFVADLKRPLLVDGGSVQFRDEPTETWFRTNHRPSGQALQNFVDRLTALASVDAYMAASLPELLWEAGRVDTLVELALTDGALPEGNDLERREIAKQRVQYALKATLRAGQDFEAARLALKAGASIAGRSRTVRLLRRNTDLAGQFLDAKVVEDLVARRSLAGSWPGSNLHYEGALLSVAPGQADLARSRLRSAVEWIVAWVREQGSEHRVTTEDIAEVALGLLHSESVQACVEFLSRWKPNRVAFDAGLIVATRLADTGRIDELRRLAWASRGLKYLQFAVATAAWHANIVCDALLARRLVKMLQGQRRPVDFRRGRFRDTRDEHHEVCAVAWIVAMGMRHHVLCDQDAETLLTRTLPKNLGRGAGSSYGSPIDPLMCGFALLSKARRQPFDIHGIAGPDVVEAKEQSRFAHSHALEDYENNVVPLAPWASLWIDALVNGHTDSQFAELANSALRDYPDYRTPDALVGGIARLGAKALALDSSETSRQRFLAWCSTNVRHLRYQTLIAVVRAAATHPDMEQIAVVMAGHVRASLDTAKIGAEAASDYLVQLARAIFRFSTVEALDHFTQAIDITDRVGDEAYARWRVLLGLAEAASAPDHSDDRRAYRVGQLVEGLEPYLGDVDQTAALTAIAHLSPTTTIASASRWRDRRFCAVWPFVRAVIAGDGAPPTVAPTSALALLPFECNNDPLALLLVALEHSPADGRRVLRVMGDFLRSTGFSTESYAHLDEAVSKLGIDLAGTPFHPSDRRVAQKSSYSSRTSRDRLATNRESEDRLREARNTLASCDLTTVDGWETARELMKEPGVRLRMQDLADHASQVPLSRLADMIAAFQANPRFSVFDYNTMICMLDGLPVLPQSARRETRGLAHHIAERFGQELTTRGYDPIDSSILTRITQSDVDLVGLALRRLGAEPTDLDTEQCFELANRLGQRLCTARAREVLDDLCGQMTQVAAEDFGDGEFDSVPSVPSQISACFAGYLWVALGDPEPRTRWRAAHSVRLLIELGCHDEVRALHGFATGELDTGPFIDARLPFYAQHARQWLLVAIARAARDPSNIVTLQVFTPLLKRVLFDDWPHAVMQASAVSALTVLANSGTVDLTTTEQDKLQQVNVPIAVALQPWAERIALTKLEPLAADVDEELHALPNADRHMFFWDFLDHWCDPLGEAFGLPKHEILRRAHRVLVECWPDWDQDHDPRHELKLFGDAKTYTHKYDWPEAEDLRFYKSVHALWTVAGELIADHTVYQDTDCDEDLFIDWLRRFTISRSDGRWLSDRRDPAPVSTVEPEDVEDPDWIWRLARYHFAERLLVDDGWVTVWEHADESVNQADQQVWIRSAFANRDSARALLIALQTAPSYMAYRLPNAGDDSFQYDSAGFELTGWLVDPDHRGAADDHDPLAASIKYPPCHPADQFVRALDLIPDDDMRIWYRAGEPALRSRVWNDTAEDSQGRVKGLKGERLQIRHEVLQELLTATGRSMIVEVMIDRTNERHRQNNWSQDDDEGFHFLERSFKVYVFDESGGCGEL